MSVEAASLSRTSVRCVQCQHTDSGHALGMQRSPCQKQSEEKSNCENKYQGRKDLEERC